MKKLYVLFLLLSVMHLNAQTPQLKFITHIDSNVYSACCFPNSQFVTNIVKYQLFNINLTNDSLKYQVFWGDGTNSTYITPFYGSLSTNLYNIILNHSYTATGVFSLMIIAGTKNTNAEDTTYYPNFSIVGSHCDTISGNFYHDMNNDCLLNTGDILLTNRPSNLRTYYANNFIFFNVMIYYNGSAYYCEVPVGFANQQPYSIKLNNPAIYGGICPASGEQIVSTFPATNKDFGFQCDTNIDNAVYISNAKVAFSNLQGVINFNVINLHCDSVQTTIKIVIDPKTTAGLNSNPLPSSVINASTGDTVVYSNVWIHSIETKAFQLNLAAIPTIMVGDTLIFKAIVIPQNTEVKLINNYDTVMIRVVASFDPNEIQVSPFGIIHNQTVLDYNIDFQNTGNAPAAKVVIIDSLSNKLDMSTFTFKGSSHAVEIQKLQNNIVKFVFNPIFLPDSGQNKEGSKGYVSFAIKTSGVLPIGTQIPNKAWIYFDDNPPVETNTVVNHIDSLINLPEIINERYINDIAVIYPNPAYDFINVNFNEDLKDASLTIYDLNGRIVFYQLCNEKSFQIPLQAIENGMYLIQLQNKTYTKLKKMLICR